MIRRRITAVAVLAGLAFAGSATPALAHNSLVDSNPKDAATLDAGPQTVQLTFDQPVQDGEGANTLAVLGPQGDHWESGPPQVSGNVVTAPVRPLGPAGTYQVNYRILSADGHPVSAGLKFTLSKAGNGTPTPPDELAKFSSAPAQSSDSGGGIPTWVWIVGAVLLLGVGIVFAMRMGGKEEDA
ncbi:copper resistance CopC family protein [Actinocrispum sp. NPDC049592]|uniref:copper resistance CopC family protein n=1 Tax=Actinocrispum sp. NPDC049592 TaxID=3154835 RepID=UPI003422CF63